MGICTLTYSYVDEILELRKPHRHLHLDHVARFSAERGLVIAGAVGDPPTGALFVFEGEPAAEEAAAFVAGDPYVEAGLVTESVIEPWNVVTRRPFGDTAD